MVSTRRSTRILSRIFASGSTPVRTRQEQGKTMPKKLEGKVAVVTGGTEGIGLATAKLFAKEGAYVFITKSAEKPRHSCRGWIGVGRAGLNAQEPTKTHAVPEPSMGEGTAKVEAPAFMPGRTSTGRRQKELDEAVKAIGTNVSGVQGDVAQLADLDRLYETVSNTTAKLSASITAAATLG